jgi:Oxidoreductase family, NAD-binding Rossmann fold
MSRPLRWGMIGGGEGAFIGAVHRMAARVDGRYQLIAAVPSSDPEKSKRSGVALSLAADRVYPTVEALVAGEANRTDGVEVVSVVTPNHMHYSQCAALLEAGLDVICDKPLTTNLADAEKLRSFPSSNFPHASVGQKCGGTLRSSSRRADGRSCWRASRGFVGAPESMSRSERCSLHSSDVMKSRRMRALPFLFLALCVGSLSSDAASQGGRAQTVALPEVSRSGVFDPAVAKHLPASESG